MFWYLSVEIVWKNNNTVSQKCTKLFQSEKNRTKTYLLHSVLERWTAKNTDSYNCSAHRLVNISLRSNTVPCHTDSATEKKIGHITIRTCLMLQSSAHFNSVLFLLQLFKDHRSYQNDNLHFVCVEKLSAALGRERDKPFIENYN